MKVSFDDSLKRALQKISALGIEIFMLDDKKFGFYGDMDGASIYLPQSPSSEVKLFTLIHLTAHTFQWSLSNRYVEIGSQLFFKPDTNLKNELMKYEIEAACFSLALLNKLEIYGLDIWFTQYSRCDLAYLEHYYSTGEQRPLASFYKADVEPLEKLSLPLVERFRKYVIINKGLVIY